MSLLCRKHLKQIYNNRKCNWENIELFILQNISDQVNQGIAHIMSLHSVLDILRYFFYYEHKLYDNTTAIKEELCIQ